MNISTNFFGNYGDQDIYIFEMSNKDITVSISNFGATITSIIVPDAQGNAENVVLGYSALAEYIKDDFYIGCVVGRVAGRINNASFLIDEVEYNLPKNDGDKNIHLHGGVSGFNKKVFEVRNIHCDNESISVEFYYRSSNLEEGYPGNLDVWTTFNLTNKNELSLKYKAVTDKSTHVNLTNHSYFNLSGEAGTALQQELFINADNFIVTDENYIPTGVIQNVADTSYDFRTLRGIDKYIEHLSSPGYNECYVLNGNEETIAAELYDAASGRRLTVATTSPGLLFYSGDYLDGDFCRSQGVCLETQFFPDTPNRPEFPSTLLHPDQEFQHQTTFKFSW